MHPWCVSWLLPFDIPPRLHPSCSLFLHSSHHSPTPLGHSSWSGAPNYTSRVTDESRYRGPVETFRAPEKKMGVRGWIWPPASPSFSSLLPSRFYHRQSPILSFCLSSPFYLSLFSLPLFLGYPTLPVSVPRADQEFFAIALRLRVLCTRSANARGYFIRRMLFNAPRSYSRVPHLPSVRPLLARSLVFLRFRRCVTPSQCIRVSRCRERRREKKRNCISPLILRAAETTPERNRKSKREVNKDMGGA